MRAQKSVCASRKEKYNEKDKKIAERIFGGGQHDAVDDACSCGRKSS